MVFERPEFFAIEARRRSVHALKRKVFDHLLAREEFGLIVERPAQEHQIVDDRVGQVPNFFVEINDHGVEGFGGEG